MRSVRLAPDLDEQVRLAAAAEGISVSQFIRTAVTERARRTLRAPAEEALADVIGTVRGGGGQARDTGRAFTDVVAARHRRT